MKPRILPARRAAFTMIELLVSTTISSAVGIAVFAFIYAGMILTASNLSLNLTSNQMRGALDRLEQVLQQGDTNPVLIDTAGATVVGNDAAGVRLDRYLGGPYVVSASSLAVGSTAIVIMRSTDALASPPIPVSGDVLRIDGAPATLRPLVRASPPIMVTAASSAHEAIACPLTTPLDAAVVNSASSIITAKLIRQVGFLVISNGSKRELRYYHSMETGSLSDPTKYTVISDQLANQGVDATPFSTVTIDGKEFIRLSLRVRSSDYDNRLRNPQSDEFNTFSRVDSFLRPKINP